MKVVVYARVSTLEQANSGLSINAQLEKLRGYCQLHDLEVVAECVDEGESAGDLKRPQLERALGLLRSGEALGLVVFKLDRLSRRMKDWMFLLSSFFDRGIRLFSVSESIDTSSATGRAMLSMIMLFAEWERDMIRERTVVAMAQKKRQGESCGQIEYGRKLKCYRDKSNPDGTVTRVPVTEDCEREQRVLTRMRELRGQGWSYRRIAGVLNFDGVPTKTGSGEWAGETVRKILLRSAK